MNLQQFSINKLVFSIILLVFTTTGFSQVKLYEDEFHGGVTGAGWSSYGWGNSAKVVTVHNNPCSQIKKAYFIAGRIGRLKEYEQYFVLKGDTLKVNVTSEASPLWHSRAYGANCAVHAWDVTHLIDPNESQYNFFKKSVDFQDYYLYIAYEDPCLPLVRTSVFVNDHNMDSWFTWDNINFDKPTMPNSDVGYALIGGYMCGGEGNDWEYVIVNSDTLGKQVGGADGGSGADCSGVKGDFYYEDNTLNGLDNDDPDLAMKDGDGLSNLESILTPGTMSMDLSFYQGCLGGVAVVPEGCVYPNQGDTVYGTQSNDNFIWGAVFAYGAGINDKAVIYAGPDRKYCPGESLQLEAKGGTTYRWDSDPTLSCSECPNPIATPTQATTYVVRSGPSCCEIIDSIRVELGANQVNVHPEIVACAPVMQTLTPLTVATATGFQWSNGESIESISVSSTGTYYVNWVSNFCSGVDTFHVVLAPNPDVRVLATDVSCTGGGDDGLVEAQAYEGIPPYSFQWTNGATVSKVSGLSEGDYTVTVTDGKGCRVTKTVSIENFNDKITADITFKKEADCAGNGGRATVTPGGGEGPYTYLWSDGQTARTATSLSPGAYEVDVTDANGCTGSTTAIISAAGDLQIETVVTLDDACDRFGGTLADATVTPSGGNPPYTYQWDDVLNQTSATATGLSVGTYNVVVTDNGGCSNTEVVEVEEKIQINFNIDNVPCQSCSDGQITATIGGFGIPPFTYRWNDGNEQTTLTATGLTPGTYVLLVTDSVGCFNSDTITIGVTGINDQTLNPKYQLTIFPNPNNGNFTIELSSSKEGLLKIFDARGRLVLSELVNSESAVMKVNLKQGIYFMLLETEGGISAGKMMISR